jgi:hypothetical protein
MVSIGISNDLAGWTEHPRLRRGVRFKVSFGRTSPLYDWRADKKQGDTRGSNGRREDKQMTYHSKMMNIRTKDFPIAELEQAYEYYPDEVKLAYKYGHRDARHAAAGIAQLADNTIEDLVIVCERLLEIVKLQNGNLHEDINAIQSEALTAIAKARGETE